MTAKNKKSRKKITRRYLENAGAYYLNRFASSRKHFQTVMRRKIDLSMHDHPEQDYNQCLKLLEEVTCKFENLGYLNDESYARQIVRSHRLKGKSERAIRQTLRQKAVSDSHIQKALDSYHDDIAGDDISGFLNKNINHEYLFALRYCQKKRFGPFAKTSQNINKEKDMARLARAGYNYEVTKKTLDTNAIEAETLLRTFLNR